jgi:hypothetical protein
MSDNKTIDFVGQVKTIKTQYGEIIKVALGPNDFTKLENHKNDKGWVNLEIKTKRDGSHYMAFQAAYAGGSQAAVNASEDIPF